MFTFNGNAVYSNISSPKVVDERIDGMKYSIHPISYVGEKSGTALIAQYLGTLFNKIGYSASIDEAVVNAIYDESRALDRQNGIQSGMFPTLESSMNACMRLGFVKNTELTMFNDVKTLKWQMHEYKNAIVQLRLTDTTKNAYDFEISSTGYQLADGKYTKGFIVMQYDSEGLILQNSLGRNAGAAGFNRMAWQVFESLFVDGSTFKVK